MSSKECLRRCFSSSSSRGRGSLFSIRGSPLHWGGNLGVCSSSCPQKQLEKVLKKLTRVEKLLYQNTYYYPLFTDTPLIPRGIVYSRLNGIIIRDSATLVTQCVLCFDIIADIVYENIYTQNSDSSSVCIINFV